MALESPQFATKMEFWSNMTEQQVVPLYYITLKKKWSVVPEDNFKLLLAQSLMNLDKRGLHASGDHAVKVARVLIECELLASRGMVISDLQLVHDLH